MISPDILSKALISIFLPSIACGFTAHADDAVTLPPIQVEGSSTDALLYDPIVPTRGESLRPTSASGSSVRPMEMEMPTPVTDYGVPGTTAQFRGLGLTVDETNVQTLGVPLNPVEGGGFDFSTFSQFFWSDYRFHLGPSTGAYDPSAVSGTLSLTPWTASVLRDEGPHARLTETVTRGLNQTSVGGKYDGFAALVGVSSIDAKGPTGSLSSWLLNSHGLQIQAHLLATQVDQTSPDSPFFPTPQARLKTTRWMPIVQIDGTPWSDVLIKNTFFYDQDSVRYVDPGDPSSDSYDRTMQFGGESVALFGDWTVGASARKASFEGIGFQAPDEWVGHAQAERTLHLGAVTLNANFDADGVSRIGFRPGGELGARYDGSENWGIFAKTTFSYRFPTLQDRYPQYAGYTPNPSLGPERALSVNAGGEWIDGVIQSTLQAYLQFRGNTQILTVDPSTFDLTVQNEGNAQELSLLHDLTWKATKWVDLIHSLRLSSSRVEATDERIPYDPMVTEVLRVRFHEIAETPKWGAGASARAVTSSPSGYGTNAGYAFFDLDADYLISKIGGRGTLTIQGSIEDVANRPVEVVSGYPFPGRLFALSVIGSL